MSLPIRIAPSLLSADFARLSEQIRLVEDAGADLLHVDVMDGHFVPNITIGPFVVRAIRDVARVPLDVHLMIDRPAFYAEAFAKAGAHWLTYHVECAEGGPETAETIRALGMRPGVSVKPDTPVGAIRDHLPLVDMVLVMSVEPGFGGQSFRAGVLPKLAALRDAGFAGELEIDGGIDEKTIGVCAAAGANVFVAGSAVYRTRDPAAAVRVLRASAEAKRVS